MDNYVLETPDAYNRFRVSEGINPISGLKMSEYITFVKAKKVISAMTENEMSELNNIIFGVRLNKFNKWTKAKLISKLDLQPHVRLMRFLFVREKEGLLDSLLCLLGKKKFDFDQKFLTNYFKYGTAIKSV